jgi:hypothetical protein
VNEQKVFWIDHGSSDKLGNYQNDGRLVARPIEGGPLQVLASALPGPYELELTSNYAYMLVDSVGGLKPFALVRLPLAGGPLETLKSQTIPIGARATSDSYEYGGDVLATSASFAYVANDGGIYRVAETAGATLEVALTEYNGTNVIADAAGVYLFSAGGASSEIDFMPPTGDQATLFHRLTTGLGSPLALDASYLYFQEQPVGPCCDNSSYLARVDRTSGATKRVAKMNEAGTFALRDGRFFGNEPLLNARNGEPLADRIFQGSLASPDTVADLVVDAPETLRFMAPSSVGLFFAGKGGVRLAPFLP